MRRRVLLPFAFVVLLLLGLDTGVWFFASSRLRQHFTEWQTTAQAAGWEVGSGSVGLTGWPFAAGVTVANLTLRRSTAAVQNEADFATPAMTLTISAFDTSKLHFGFANPMHLRVAGLPDLVLSGEAVGLTTPVRAADPQPVLLQANTLRIEPAVGSWHALVGSLMVNADFAMTGSPPASVMPAAGILPGPSGTGSPTAAAPSTGSPGPARSAASPSGSGALAAATTPVADMRLQAHAIALPNTAKWAFGNDIAALSGRLTLDGAWPGPGTPDAVAQAWRDKGGALAISDLVLDWGKLRLGGLAKIQLDQALQPAGSATLHIADYAQALDRLAASGMLSRSAATAATALLSLLAGGSDSARPGSVDVPLTLQSRTLSMGELPLLRLPMLDWRATR